MVFAVFDMGANVPKDIFKALVDAADKHLKIFCDAWRYLPDIVVDGLAAGYDPQKADFGLGTKEAEWVVPVYIFKTPDVPNAGGYHDKDPQGRAYCKVFSDPYLLNGGSWIDGTNSVSVALTHEIGEARGDYNAAGWDAMSDGRFTAQEVSDAVEETFFSVTTETGRAVSVSNFLLPDWSDDGSAGPYDYLELLRAPYTKTPGGYWIVMDQQGNITQEFGTAMPDWKKELKRYALEKKLFGRIANRFKRTSLSSS